MTKTPPQVEIHPVVLKLKPVINLTDDQLFQFCQLNGDWRIEYTAQGELIIMPPTGGETSNRNAEITFQVQSWTRQDQTGVAFDSSCGFKLPNGAIRSPDAAWVRRVRLAVLTREQKQAFLPLCPDFVIELRSPTDSLQALQDKLQEYLDNGAQLGWLIDPLTRRVHVYLPQHQPQVIETPSTVSGDPLLPGFVLDLQQIWEPEI